MTEPAKAALLKCSNVLWTVKPTVSLPAKEEILKGLCVCTEPSYADVIQNLKNICDHSKFADISLFDKYPKSLKKPTHATPMMDIFCNHFGVLQGHISKTVAKTLCELPCVPVRASPDSFTISDMVLVKPSSVLCCDVRDYYPFLHHLPSEFTYVTPLMEDIGVKRVIDLDHIQTVLQSAYECSGGQEIEVNTRKCIKRAVTQMYKMLKRSKEESDKSQSMNEDTIAKLSPLYLPSRSKTLCLSTELVYHDVTYLPKSNLDLQTTQYAELDIMIADYGFYDSELCDLLPPLIRPKGLSPLCSAEVAQECRPCDPSDLMLKLSRTFSLGELPTALVTLVKSNIFKGKKSDEDLQPFMETFFNHHLL